MRNRGYEIKILMTEQVTEYSSSEKKCFTHANGIDHILKGRSTHEKMDVAERMNRSITDMIREIILDYGFDKYLLGHAFLYATTFRNRCTKETLWK